MVDDTAGPEVSIRIAIWKNVPLTEWVDGSFRTELEMSAAWAMFGHLCDNYVGVRELVRGTLKSSEEQDVD